jgi:hypothetical protein
MEVQSGGCSICTKSPPPASSLEVLVPLLQSAILRADLVLRGSKEGLIKVFTFGHGNTREVHCLM